MRNLKPDAEQGCYTKCEDGWAQAPPECDRQGRGQRGIGCDMLDLVRQVRGRGLGGRDEGIDGDQRGEPDGGPRREETYQGVISAGSWGLGLDVASLNA